MSVTNYTDKNRCCCCYNDEHIFTVRIMAFWMKTKQMFEADLLMECEMADRMEVRDQMSCPCQASCGPRTASLGDFG